MSVHICMLFVSINMGLNFYAILCSSLCGQTLTDSSTTILFVTEVLCNKLQKYVKLTGYCLWNNCTLTDMNKYILSSERHTRRNNHVRRHSGCLCFTNNTTWPSRVYNIHFLSTSHTVNSLHYEFFYSLLNRVFEKNIIIPFIRFLNWIHSVILRIRFIDWTQKIRNYINLWINHIVYILPISLRTYGSLDICRNVCWGMNNRFVLSVNNTWIGVCVSYQHCLLLCISGST